MTTENGDSLTSQNGDEIKTSAAVVNMADDKRFAKIEAAQEEIRAQVGGVTKLLEKLKDDLIETLTPKPPEISAEPKVGKKSKSSWYIRFIQNI